METSKNGLNLIKQFEGCHLTSYKCPAGVWTIGYGHTQGVTEGQSITQEQADLYLKTDLKKFEQFTGQTDTTEVSSAITSSADTGDSESTENRKYAVQYLINYDDKVINMRLIDYSAQKFDLYAELDENQMKMVILCLKYYFGPLS
jgi:hypothetical protein